jgi:predicted N-acetyltransferase YhbS
MRIGQWTVRESAPADRDRIGGLHRAAFGHAEGPVIERLVAAMLDDPTAEPVLSLLAEAGGELLGHVLFTAARVVPGADGVTAAILAPLAVRPDGQGLGIGTALARDGLERLRADGVGLVFVLGHIDYYPRLGFRPAGEHGFMAPYPIPDAVADAWMVQELQPGIIGRVAGTVQCCAALDHPGHWIE